MHVGMIRIPCKNLVEAEHFYTQQLGLALCFGSADDGFIGYQLDNLQIMIEAEEQGEFETGRFLGFSLVVADISAAYQAWLAKGVTFTGPPETQEWGGIMTHIVDCSGNSFSLVQEF